MINVKLSCLWGNTSKKHIISFFQRQIPILLFITVTIGVIWGSLHVAEYSGSSKSSHTQGGKERELGAGGVEFYNIKHISFLMKFVL